MKVIFFSGLFMDPNYLNSSVSSGERRIIIKKPHLENEVPFRRKAREHRSKDDTEFPGIMWNIETTDHWTN